MNHAQDIECAIKFLQAEGYTVLLLEKWMQLVDYRDQLGMKANTISSRLRHPSCPPFESRRGARGRIYEIQPNDALTKFLLEYGKPRGKSGKK
jgi:hypothetical protein